MMLKLKLQYFGHLMAKSWLIGKDSDGGRDWGQEEKGTTKDEMAGWHHWLDGRESEWTLGDGDGQRGLACCDSWGCKESDRTEWLNLTELNWTPLPGGASGKEPACQCMRFKRCGFNPWVGKIPWRQAGQPTPVFLPGEFHGQRSLMGQSIASHRVKHEWSNLWHTHARLSPNLPDPHGSTEAALLPSSQWWSSLDSTCLPHQGLKFSRSKGLCLHCWSL